MNPRDEVIQEFRPPCDCDPWCRTYGEDGCHADEMALEATADEIVRLRERLAAVEADRDSWIGMYHIANRRADRAERILAAAEREVGP